MEACWLLVLWPGKCTRQRTVGGWGFADMVSHTETHRHGAWAWPPGLGGLSARLDTQLGLEAQRTQKRRSPRRRRPESGGGGLSPQGVVKTRFCTLQGGCRKRWEWSGRPSLGRGLGNPGVS